MMDMLIHSAYPGRHFSAFISGRCHRCGQGMVVASDGFMMVRCDTCGRYLSNEPSDFGFGLRPMKVAIKDFLGRLKERITFKAWSRPAASSVATPEGT